MGGMGTRTYGIRDSRRRLEDLGACDLDDFHTVLVFLFHHLG